MSDSHIVHRTRTRAIGRFVKRFAEAGVAVPDAITRQVTGLMDDAEGRKAVLQIADNLLSMFPARKPPVRKDLVLESLAVLMGRANWDTFSAELSRDDARRSAPRRDDGDDARDLVGLSLSFCVRDILSGAVPYGRVRIIVAGTRITVEDVWETVFRSYAVSYWSGFPQDEVRSLVSRLRREDRIEQPWLEQRDGWHSIADGHWTMASDYDAIHGDRNSIDRLPRVRFEARPERPVPRRW